MRKQPPREGAEDPRKHWLDDLAVNGYLEAIARLADRTYTLHMLPAEMERNSVLFLNSFFYETLKARGAEGAARWLDKVDLSAVRTIIFPIFAHSHWSLGVVDPHRKRAGILDSLRPMHFSCFKVLEALLGPEATYSYDSRCLQQGNGSDCGVFACYFAECMMLRKGHRTRERPHCPFDPQAYRRQIKRVTSQAGR